MYKMLKENSEERLGSWNQSLSGTNEQSRQKGYGCEREAGQDEGSAYRVLVEEAGDREQKCLMLDTFWITWYLFCQKDHFAWPL